MTDGKTQPLDLTPEQQAEVRELLKRHLPGTEVWAYGSRVRGTAKPWSDLDLVVFADAGQRMRVEELREAFEESDLPFRLDLFIWDEVPESFRKNIVQERVVLQEKSTGSPESGRG